VCQDVQVEEVEDYRFSAQTYKDAARPGQLESVNGSFSETLSSRHLQGHQSICQGKKDSHGVHKPEAANECELNSRGW